jgi:hypothetical protein
VRLNMDSKSTLRAAAAHFSGGHADVHYFPSYEMVVYTDPSLPGGPIACTSRPRWWPASWIPSCAPTCR